jgi:hypothetical protein
MTDDACELLWDHAALLGPEALAIVLIELALDAEHRDPPATVRQITCMVRRAIRAEAKRTWRRC